jgi:predicted nucleic acid-binding protein
VSVALYLDTSAVLRATLEEGTTPDVEARIGAAAALLTSRLSLVESSRAFLRLRELAKVPEERIAGAEGAVERLWSRCEVWELTPTVCELARQVAPRGLLRTLDALHLATFVLARRRIEGLDLLSTDDRLLRAAAMTG